jgi:ribonucleotide reductase alpha subunit
MLKVYNSTARYWDQGGGKRNGSFAIYLEPWHPDVEDFLEMKKNHGDEELKARDLFYALWISDLFMERVKTNAKWSLFCPHECPGLSDVYGEKFVELYEKYETEGKSRKIVNARELWFKILDAQMETGTPYILYKDAVNKKSNQQNLGTIKSSNLCVAPETLVLTDKGHVSIQDICGQYVNDWNGEEWSNVLIQKTGENQELIEVKISDGSSLFCTKYHKFYVITPGTTGKVEIETKEAQVLIPGDNLASCQFPIIKENINSAFQLFAELCDEGGIIVDGYLTVDGDYTRLKNAKYLLQTCGVNAKIIRYLSDNKAKLFLTRDSLVKLEYYGFKCNKIDIPSSTVYDAKKGCLEEWKIEVVDIVDTGRIDDTYCFTEPKYHIGIFNCILTGQCTEITEYSDETETAVCNLASIALPTFVNTVSKEFDYVKLHDVVKVVTNNLNRVIDINFYPTEKTKISNLRHRPIGIGVQGLADTFVLMDLPFHSEEAKTINKQIFETIYHASLQKSNEIAIQRYEQIVATNYNSIKIHGVPKYLNDYEMKAFKPNCAKSQEDLQDNFRVGSYSSFNDTPASKGVLQFDMWNVEPSDRYDWFELKQSIIQFGLRNSLLVAPMPTASTSQILGFNECFEPFTSNLYSRRTLAGEFVVVNKYLVNELIQLGL